MTLFYARPRDEGLIALRKSLESREGKTISTDTLMDLAECVLKNNSFEHNLSFFKQNLSFFKQLRGTAIGTKMAPSMLLLLWETWKNESYKTSVLNH